MRLYCAHMNAFTQCQCPLEKKKKKRRNMCVTSKWPT